MAKIKKKLRGEGARPATRNRGMSYMEVVVKLYQAPTGVEDLKEAFEKGHVSKASIKSALEYLDKQSTKPENFEEFKELSESFAGDGTRGRAPPVTGETRSFKAQKLKDGNAFLRLPLDFLHAKKGDAIYPPKSGIHAAVDGTGRRVRSSSLGCEREKGPLSRAFFFNFPVSPSSFPV